MSLIYGHVVLDHRSTLATFMGSVSPHAKTYTPIRAGRYGENQYDIE